MRLDGNVFSRVSVHSNRFLRRKLSAWKRSLEMKGGWKSIESNKRSGPAHRAHDECSLMFDNDISEREITATS